MKNKWGKKLNTSAKFNTVNRGEWKLGIYKTRVKNNTEILVVVYTQQATTIESENRKTKNSRKNDDRRKKDTI